MRSTRSPRTTSRPRARYFLHTHTLQPNNPLLARFFNRTRRCCAVHACATPTRACAGLGLRRTPPTSPTTPTLWCTSSTGRPRCRLRRRQPSPPPPTPPPPSPPPSPPAAVAAAPDPAAAVAAAPHAVAAAAQLAAAALAQSAAPHAARDHRPALSAPPLARRALAHRADPARPRHRDDVQRAHARLPGWRGRAGTGVRHHLARAYRRHPDGFARTSHKRGHPRSRHGHAHRDAHN